jgi:hypothetical protein
MGQENFRICIGPWTKAHSQIPTDTVYKGIASVWVIVVPAYALNVGQEDGLHYSVLQSIRDPSLD